MKHRYKAKAYKSFTKIYTLGTWPQKNFQETSELCSGTYHLENHRKERSERKSSVLQQLKHILRVIHTYSNAITNIH